MLQGCWTRLKVAAMRRIEYTWPEPESLFLGDGAFKEGLRPAPPPVNDEARQMYLRRYLNFFPSQGLNGLRMVFFQHSAVGRDRLVDLFRELGSVEAIF